MVWFQAIILEVLYEHVSLSMSRKREPQLHSEVRSRCGSGLVGVDVHIVAVARLLGTSEHLRTIGIGIAFQSAVNVSVHSRLWTG